MGTPYPPRTRLTRCQRIRMVILHYSFGRGYPALILQLEYLIRARFIDDLAREALSSAFHDWFSTHTHSISHSRSHRSRSLSRVRTSRQTPSARIPGPLPILTDSVHALLASWSVAYFAPRGIRIYAALDGRRVIPPPLELDASRHGSSRPDEWSDEGSEWSEEDEEEEEEDELMSRRQDMYLPRRERDMRRDERARERRRNRRRRDFENERTVGIRGDWEVHFVCATPTIWTPGARPRTYGEPVLRSRQ